MKLFVTGDVILTDPWSADEDPRFLKLLEVVRSADASFCNLEILLNDGVGHPQIDSGGLHMGAAGDLAAELRWAGFDMVSHANNHAFDYGADGLLASIAHVEKSGLIQAGAGEDLQSARAPRYFETEHGTVALVAMTTCLQRYARAGRSRWNAVGRPGLNPLEIPPSDLIDDLERAQCGLQDSLGARGLRWPGVRIAKPKKADVEANLHSIREARNAADVVVVSLHTHIRGPWRQRFARAAIDAGADVLFAHGRHYVQGVEVYEGRPVFYGLGSFAFEIYKLHYFADQLYRQHGLDDSATVEDLRRARDAANAHRGARTRPKNWRSLGASVDLVDGRLTDVSLIPIDIGFGAPIELEGRPRWAEADLGGTIIAEVAHLSKRYRCHIEYSATEGVGKIRC